MRSINSDVNAEQREEAQQQVVPYVMLAAPSMPVSAPPGSFNLVLRTRIPHTWEVEFPKAWYDLDDWYSGKGCIKQRITNAFLSGVKTVLFDAVTHGEDTMYEVDLDDMTQRNLKTNGIRNIRPVYAYVEQPQQESDWQMLV